VILKLPIDLVRAYYAQQPLGLPQPAAPSLLHYPPNPLLDSLFASLLPYLALEQPLPAKLVEVKVTEGLEILRSLDSRSDGLLADFREPGKLNLVEFMEANYMFNLPLAKFSYLTGRSLTTFKRDFNKAFQQSPQRWLTQKRLALAHYQLAEKQRKPAELYLEVGFENLAHFSTAFKKQFGYPPTALTGPRARQQAAA
jgi:AraC-like DNA-binding protein